MDAKDLLHVMSINSEKYLSEIINLCGGTIGTPLKFSQYEGKDNYSFKTVSQFSQSFYNVIKDKLTLISSVPNGITICTAHKSYSFSPNFRLRITFATPLALRIFAGREDAVLLKNISGIIYQVTNRNIGEI